jgi:hypothetical protein
MIATSRPCRPARRVRGDGARIPVSMPPLWSSGLESHLSFAITTPCSSSPLRPHRRLAKLWQKRDAPIITAEICRVDRKRPGDKIAIRRATRLTTVTPVKRFCNAAATFQQQM